MIAMLTLAINAGTQLYIQKNKNHSFCVLNNVNTDFQDQKCSSDWSYIIFLVHFISQNKNFLLVNIFVWTSHFIRLTAVS